MSMSQEEIEALMNESADLEPAIEEAPQEEVIDTSSDDTEMTDEDIAALVASSDDLSNENNTEEDSEENIDDILSGIDGITEDESEVEPEEDNTPADMDDILAGIEGITEDEPVSTPAPVEAESLTSQIDKGIYPLPVEKEHKVVNQLNEVAEDSEKKVSQIFDVLSFILDENSEMQQEVKTINKFMISQVSLLEALSAKFPNVEVLNENLISAKSIQPSLDVISGKLDEENNQIFVAMDLMQFNDINRQKIERVMSVIKKLSSYLNGLFEDTTDKPEVQIAKHISGDSDTTVDESDIESLISEFSN